MCWSARTRWGGIFDIDGKTIQLEEEELRTQDPGFWEDAKRAEAQMKKVRELKKWIELYNEVNAAAEELQLAYEYVKEDIITEDEVDAAYAKALELVENL